MRPSIINGSNVVGERKETLLFTLRLMLPLIISRVELRNGQRGAETTHEVMASVLKNC